jgi:hypothetical protein
LLYSPNPDGGNEAETKLNDHVITGLIYKLLLPLHDSGIYLGFFTGMNIGKHIAGCVLHEIFGFLLEIFNNRCVVKKCTSAK